ncbi:thiol reductant ABC exporter subunit CydC [Nocardioides stalactiti]|uniref:thiol reductant ABC exporter subunit CydC n=1 Tax=Nocardioides stalactiti TaxID=2755356 RepID=UPI0016019FFB|nr:thiol reductant ABC exporter subunit CydC [Nocardioides stalactiti]
MQPFELTGIEVTYPGRAVPALAVAHARIPATGVTAVSGPSGCGKSTLLGAVAGLVPTAGTITAAGEPIGGRAWQAEVAWLPQQPHFVEGTIADNLRLARPDASEAELWRALREVALEVRVETLPQGLDTPLGEDGVSLSAGERARLALARVVLADRPWVLLDEPTAHLDDLTERIIVETVIALGRRSAVVVVAHKAAMIAAADHLIELVAPDRDRADLPVVATPRNEDRPITRAAPPPLPDAIEPPTGSRGLAVSTVVGALASASGVALTATAGWLIVQASTRPAVLTLLVAIVGVRTFGLARPVLRYVERLRSHDTALRLLARRRVEVYDALVPLVPARLGRRRGDLLSAVVDDVDAVVDRELRVRMPVRQLALVALLTVLVAASIHPLAGLVVAGFLALAGPGAYFLARHGAQRAEHTLVELRARLSAQVVEAFQVGDELRMWQAVDRTADRIAAVSARMGRSSVAETTWLAAGRALVLGLTGVAVAGVATITSAAVADGALSGPMMALLVLLPLAVAEVVAPVADAGALSVRCRAAESRLHRLARTAPAVRETVATAAAGSAEVDVRHARTSWERGAPLTPPVDLRLQPGGRVAVVGASGSGKSTLAALLVRFLDPVEGSVRLGGQRLHDLPLDDVRRLTGLVDDHPHVFSTTLVENVRLARPTATDVEVEVALRRARLGRWLDSLPDGLHTWLGDGHAAVSGGERARIGIARSLLADQPVLVLDEPAAHLDHATATELAGEVLGGTRDRSVVWITHGTAGLDLVDDVLDLTS